MDLLFCVHVAAYFTVYQTPVQIARTASGFDEYAALCNMLQEVQESNREIVWVDAKWD